MYDAVSVIAAAVRGLVVMELLEELVVMQSVMQSGKEGGEAFHILTAQPGSALKITNPTP